MTYRSFHCLFVGYFLFTTGTCQKSIVSTTTITPGNSFVVQCDDSLMMSKRIASGTTILSAETIIWVGNLEIYRATAEDPRDVLILDYRPLTPPTIPKLYKKIPEGRNWGVKNYGDNDGVENIHTMKLSLTIYDTRCEDAGNYTCAIIYHQPTRHFSGFNITAKVVTVDPCVNPIVWPKPIEMNNTLHINCDASRFYIPKNEIFSVSTLTVYKDFGMNKDYPIAAQYMSEIPYNAHKGIPARSNFTKTMIPPGRIYQFKFSGAKPAFAPNKNMSIEWTILDTKYEDVGTFTCDMEYFTKDYKLIKLSRSEWVYIHLKRENLLPVLLLDGTKVPGYFNITCDARRVIFPSEHIRVTGILETRITVAFDKMQPSGEGSNAIINHEVWTDVCDIIQSGRKWEVIKGDYRDNYVNIDTASTKVIVHDPSCDDAGTYRCDIVYRDPESNGVFRKVTEKQRIEKQC